MVSNDLAQQQNLGLSVNFIFMCQNGTKVESDHLETKVPLLQTLKKPVFPSPGKNVFINKGCHVMQTALIDTRLSIQLMVYIQLGCC